MLLFLVGAEERWCWQRAGRVSNLRGSMSMVGAWFLLALPVS
jgi:hypothetical protein